MQTDVQYASREAEWVTSAKTSLIFVFRERQRAAGANYLRAKASKAANAGGGRGAEEAPSPPAAVGEAEGGGEVGAGGTVAQSWKRRMKMEAGKLLVACEEAASAVVECEEDGNPGTAS